MRVYRLTKTKYAATAMSGQGASGTGGRWNAVGTPMVYCASSLSLATLEVLVHVRDRAAILPAFSVIEVDVRDEAITALDHQQLPTDWRRNEPACVAVALAWVIANRSVGLLVPSAVTIGEDNLILNPLHPDFTAMATWSGHKPAAFDPCLTSGP